MVRGTAETVLWDPEKILGFNENEGAVIKEIGGTVADLLLGSDSNRQLQFQRLFSGQGLDTVFKSTLKAVTDNPYILKIGHQGFKKVFIEVADQVETVQAP